jgi:hypothetical protein
MLCLGLVCAELRWRGSSLHLPIFRILIQNQSELDVFNIYSLVRPVSSSLHPDAYMHADDDINDDIPSR